MNTHGNAISTSTAKKIRKIFTNRHGGVSSGSFSSFNLSTHVGDTPATVAANRQRLATVLGLAEEQLVFMEQIHSPHVTEVTADMLSTGAIPATDALITTLPEVALVVLTADCVALLLCDEQAGVIAAVHAGRMGARNGIVPRTIERMVHRGAVPARIHAVMGAAALGSQYEVPQDMADDVEAHLPGSLTRTAKGTAGLDIRAGLTRQLLALGVRSIDADPRCTITDENFFSYRREGTTGRQAGIIWME